MAVHNLSDNNSSSVNIRMIEIKKRSFLWNIHLYFDFQWKKFVENPFTSVTMDHMLPLHSLSSSLLVFCRLTVEFYRPSLFGPLSLALLVLLLLL